MRLPTLVLTVSMTIMVMMVVIMLISVNEKYPNLESFLLKLDLAVTKEPVEETSGLQLTMSVMRFLMKINQN